MAELSGFAGTDRPASWPPTRGRPRFGSLSWALDTLPGVGPSLRAKLTKLGLRTVRDLLERRPRDYQQAVGETPISQLFGEEEAVIAGEVRRVSVRPTRRRLTVLKAAVRDETGEISAVWFNQPWLADKLQPGTRLRLRALDELLLLQVGLARIREGSEEATAPALGEPGELVGRYREALPFELTADQELAIAEIDADLAGAKPMQRLLQGDVGSGKTVVALYALLRPVEAGKTGALMAPTETLAEQHFLTVEPI